MAPRGKLVLVGRTGDKRPAVARLARSGRADRGFGTAGTAALPVGAGNERVEYSAVATTRDGSVVAVGEAVRRLPGLTEADQFGRPQPVRQTDVVVARLTPQACLTPGSAAAMGSCGHELRRRR